MKQILVFNLSKAELGLDISCVREVLRPQTVHHLPQAPDLIEGVINVRGHIIAVADLRKRFRLMDVRENPGMRIILCKIKRFIMGLIVDGVSEVLNLSEENIEPTPEVISTQIENSCISGVARFADRIIILLDLENIITKKEAEKLSRVKK